MPDVIVLGLDGANWNLIEPWIQDGRLPNIADLRNTGISSDMMSCLPPVTCPNWRCYSTGKNPGKLGVYWWEMVNTEEQTMSIPDSRSFKSSNYWDYLNVEGKSVGIMNLPMTYPPFEIDDFMIAGGPGSTTNGYALPGSLNKKLDREEYQLHPASKPTSNEDYRSAESVVELIDHRLEWFEKILKENPVDVAHCTVFYINNLQHYFWRDKPVQDAWEIIDEHIGSICDSFPEANLILMSDHGCNQIETVFNINRWLELEGYLTTEESVKRKLHYVGINQRKIKKFLQKARLYQLIPQWMTEPFRSMIPQDDEGVKQEQKFKHINWEESEAIASGQGLIYLLNTSDSTRDEIISELESLKTDTDNKLVAKEVYKGEEIYEGSYTDIAPDIVYEQAPGLHTSGAIGQQEIFSEMSYWEAENDRTGLFLATGPSINRTSLPESISITDIAPTILHLMDTPIPTDIDGVSLRLSADEDPQFRDPITPKFVSGRVDTEARERLEDLGYL